MLSKFNLKRYIHVRFGVGTTCITKWLSCPLLLRPRIAKAGIMDDLLSIAQTNQQHIEHHGQSPKIKKMETKTNTDPNTRRAGKAGSWYTDVVEDLAPQIDGFFAKVPETIDGSSLPIPGARIIIAP